MESEKLKGSILLKNLLKEKNEWYIFRYKLLKNLYFEESHIRKDLIPSQKFFGYILKSRLSRAELLQLIDLDLLSLAVQFFRSKIVIKALEKNFLKEVEAHVQLSALLTKRKYYSKEI